MSAFLMDEQSISNIANWFYFENDTHGTYRQCQELILDLFPEWKEEEFKDNWDRFLGKELYKINCFSLTQIYEDKMKDFKEFEYKQPTTISIIQLLKSVQCWIYQSCEGKAEKKPLFKVMVKIKNILLQSIVNELKEYKEAKWN